MTSNVNTYNIAYNFIFKKRVVRIFMLTDTKIRKTKPNGKTFHLKDGRGLFLEITPKGGKWWRFRYRFEGKENRLSLGVYPDISLQMARKRREELRTLAAQGINPGEERKARKASVTAKKANTFEVVAREWIAKNTPTWSAANTKKVTSIFEKNIFPWIGGKPITNITSQDLLETLKKIDERGASHTSHRALSDCNRVFRYAAVTGRVQKQPLRQPQGSLESHQKGTFCGKNGAKRVGATAANVRRLSRQSHRPLRPPNGTAGFRATGGIETYEMEGH